MPAPIGVVAKAIADVDTPNLLEAIGVNNRDGVLRAVGNENPSPIGRDDQIPRLDTGGDCLSDLSRPAFASGIQDLDHGHVAARRVSDENCCVVGIDGNAPRVLPDLDGGYDRAVPSADYGDRII